MKFKRCGLSARSRLKILAIFCSILVILANPPVGIVYAYAAVRTVDILSKKFIERSTQTLSI